MDENKDKGGMNGHPEGCMCRMCRRGMWGAWGMSGCGCHMHGPLHIILRIVVLVLVFWLGMQFGALGAYRGGMMGWEGYGYRTAPMMGGYGDYYYQQAGGAQSQSGAQTVPAQQ